VKEDPKCSSLGIPARLHQLSKSPVEDFDASELLFGRYNPEEIVDVGLAAAAISFQNDGMSVNRGRFCNSPEDVLYNVTEGGKHYGHRYLIFSTGSLLGFLWRHPDVPQDYSLKVVHDPEQCMYPHSLVKLLCERVAKGVKERQEVEGIKSPRRKLELKEAVVALSLPATMTE
jgi:hypothetical protein